MIGFPSHPEEVYLLVTSHMKEHYETARDKLVKIVKAVIADYKVLAQGIVNGSCDGF